MFLYVYMFSWFLAKRCTEGSLHIALKDQEVPGLGEDVDGLAPVTTKDRGKEGRSAMNINKLGKFARTRLDKGRKSRWTFFNMNFEPLTQKHPFWATRREVHVPHFLGKNAKGGPKKTFSGEFWGQTRGPETGQLRPLKN